MENDSLSPSPPVRNKSLIVPVADESSFLVETVDHVDSIHYDESDDFAVGLQQDESPQMQNKKQAGRKDKTGEHAPTLRYDRLHLLEALRRAFMKREELQRTNNEIQTKLARYFKKKKTEAVSKHEANARDQELRYLKDLDLLEDLRASQVHKKHMFDDMIRRMKERSKEKMKNVEEEREKFIKYKLQVAKSSISRRTGTHVTDKELEQYASMEEKKDADVFIIRLEYIRRKNKLQQQEQQLKLKENLGEGLSLIDFEQLKIENQTYNEKIEERNEELLKLRKKITSTVQVLTHLKEKLQWLQRENQVHSDILNIKETAASEKRDILSRTKKVRDLLRRDNVKLRIEGGLRGSKVLLHDFEQQRDKLDDIIVKIETQKHHHAELSLNISRIRKKIERARIIKDI